MSTRSSRAANARYWKKYGNPESVTTSEVKAVAEKYERVAIENAQPGGVTMKFTRKAVK